MSEKIKNQYSWFPKDGNCYEIFDSIEDAIKDAQCRYNNRDDPYEDRDEYTSSVIYAGTLRRFDMGNAVKKIVEGIEDDMYDQMSDFSSGCDAESECYVRKKDKEVFIKEAVQALLPIVEKHVFINPQWICVPTGEYDLKEKRWTSPIFQIDEE
ncbi:MAG: hypothetical protein LBU37_09490 [Tannerellaceae bacterium]|jgi:hypothetical protein|nr:hypothetical protein [Tannerellaceae bacterium]